MSFEVVATPPESTRVSTGPAGPEDANFYLAVCSAHAQRCASFVYVPEVANLFRERGTRIHSS